MPLLEALAVKGLIVAIKSGAAKGILAGAGKLFAVKATTVGVGAAATQVGGALLVTGAVIGGVYITETIISKSRSFISAISQRDYKEAGLSLAELIMEAKTLLGAQDVIQTVIDGSSLAFGTKELTKEAVKGAIKECLSQGIDATPASKDTKRVAKIIEKELVSQVARRIT
ncbi:MAG: hypothetical protein OHK0022_58150 [Roseiflexaceae bacterium]